MSDDEEEVFRSRVGRIRSKGGGRAKTYLSRLAERVSRAGGSARLAAGARRGGKPAAPFAGTRRVVVKARIVRLAATGLGGQAAHLAYLQRDGVERDGSPARLYDARGEEADGRAFAERCRCDRHQFRFIVSPEDGEALASLKPFVRDLMAAAERDLGTKLDWVAADHFDTGHPHTHVVLRGCRDDGADLVIPRDYIAHGLRRRAMELVTLELGPETALEAYAKLARETGAERFTRLDRRLLGLAQDGVVTLGRGEGDAALLGARLRRLGASGLAERESGGRWRLAADLEPTLRRLGERSDIIKTMHRALARAGLARPIGPDAVWTPGVSEGRVLEGRVAALGLTEGGGERAYAVVDGLDGKARYVDLGASLPEDVRVGDLVRFDPARVASRGVDRAIAVVAAGADGRYDEALHRLHDPSARTEFIRAHVRRLEAMRRLGIVERTAEGAWCIPADYEARALGADRDRAAQRPLRLEVAARAPLSELANLDAATWLDERLAGKAEEGVAEIGFGGEAREALRLRRLWLMREQLLPAEDAALSADAVAELRRRELARLGAALEREIGLAHAPAKAGERLEGTYVRVVQLAAGRAALIARAKDFTLVPWRDVLERSLGRRVSGVMSPDGVSWEISRSRTPGR